MANRLVTTRYTRVGVYIGQLIQPRAGNLNADARLCNYVGQGSRLAVGQNLAVRRSFVFDETLDVSKIPPYAATLSYAADGSKDLPVRIRDVVTGVELLSNQWDFEKVAGEYKKVIIAQSAYNPSASYQIDYQSTQRDILDPVPVDNLRVIKSVGSTPDRAQYRDFSDFYLPFTFAQPVADSANGVTDSYITSVINDAGNTGTGVVDIDSAASFDHDYNRFYELECIAVTGVTPTRTATFQWSARRYSGGVNSLPPTPLHTTMTKPTFTILEATPASLVQDLELGIKVELDFGVTHFVVGDKFYFNGVGPGIIEFDGSLLNTNQFLSFGSIAKTGIIGSTGTLAYDSTNTYNGSKNAKFRLQVMSVAGGIGSRTVTFGWAMFGELIGPSGQVTYNEASPAAMVLTQGVKLIANFGVSHFVVGDKFDFEVKVAKSFYQAKDDRIYDLRISVVTNPGADAGHVEGSYATGTPEGRFGSWSADVNLLSGASAEDGYFELPDGITFAIRNAMQGNINGSSFALSDKFVGSVTSDDVIDWSLTKKVEEIRETTAFKTDVTGAVTGTAGTLYVILSNEYDLGSISVKTVDDGSPISHIEYPNSRFVAFVSNPGEAVVISYEYRGEEPVPGQVYYITGHFLRPAELYNAPTQVLSRPEGRLFLGPSEISNHLYIMNEIAFDNGAPGALYTQAFDADGDGVITISDMAEALAAHEGNNRATDLCVLSHFESLSNALAVNERNNDPFVRKEQMLWVGAPVGTPVGDIDTENSLVFLARRTLQTSPQSPAIGTRVLVAPTFARRNILLDSGIQTEVTLDGSFVAGAVSALVNSFTDPATTVLRKTLAGFTAMQTYAEPYNLILGGASIVWFDDEGNGVFRFQEDVTVHSNDILNQLISITTQKQYVTRVVRREMEAVIGFVAPSAQASIALIKGNLSGILLGLLGRGLIADYQDESGNVRDFSPDEDVIVLVDAADATKFDFWYAYWTRKPIKRLFGVYSLDSNNFGV